MMNFQVITLFPEMFDAITKHGITSRALERKIYSLNVINPREFTQDNHKTVDDRPYGGGPGMVMLAEPLENAIQAAKAVNAKARVIHLSPRGTPLTHEKVMQLSQEKGLILLASRYEGVDERLLDALVDEEISIGDYVLSGGELPAAILIDAIGRLIPGVLNDETSALTDSFQDNLLAPPVYTRPEDFRGWKVPDALMSGDHKKIEEWRYEQSQQRTKERRPDLLND